MKLTFITGKGGVGKSAVTAGLATALASLKFNVGVVELGETRMPDFFDTSRPEKITFLNLNAKSCFEEYAGRHIPKQAMLLIQNRWVEHFIDATPGLNEILLLGKIASLIEEESWDFLLVDSPATGHTISLCDAPRIALNALHHGPLKSSVEKIWQLLHDPSQTDFLLVTELENFIVQETAELYQHISESLEMKPQGVLVNGMLDKNFLLPDALPKKFPPEAIPLMEILSATRERKKREEQLLREIKKTIPLDFGEITQQESAVSESSLRKTIAEQIKPWVLKHYSKKNV